MREATHDHEARARDGAALLRELGLEVRVDPARPGEGHRRVRARDPEEKAWAALTWYRTGSFLAQGEPAAVEYAREPLERHGLAPLRPAKATAGRA